EPSQAPIDYSAAFSYVCASSYEGFSMSPIEALYAGCPALMSDIPAHQAIVQALFPEWAEDFVYPVGNAAALALLMRDEVQTERRRKRLPPPPQQTEGDLRARGA